MFWGTIHCSPAAGRYAVVITCNTFADKYLLCCFVQFRMTGPFNSCCYTCHGCRLLQKDICSNNVNPKKLFNWIATSVDEPECCGTFMLLPCQSQVQLVSHTWKTAIAHDCSSVIQLRKGSGGGFAWRDSSLMHFGKVQRNFRWTLPKWRTMVKCNEIFPTLCYSATKIWMYLPKVQRNFGYTMLKCNESSDALC